VKHPRHQGFGREERMATFLPVEGWKQGADLGPRLPDPFNGRHPVRPG
jgi:hypothetical protein